MMRIEMVTTEYAVEKYTAQDKGIWDGFIAESINGTFLFSRSFMDYHEDRFTDGSYLIYEKGRLLAVFVAAVAKASKDQRTLVAHPGLTYGGMVHGHDVQYYQLENAYDALLKKIKQDGFTKVVIKPVAKVFCKVYSDAQSFYFFKKGIVLQLREINSIIDLTSEIRLTRARRKNIRKAEASGLLISPSDDYAGFWAIMTESLMKTHGVTPVHTVDEIRKLAAANPNNIKLYVGQLEGRAVCGTLLFIDPARGFVHTQYTHATEEGRSVRAIDAVVVNTIKEAQSQGLSKLSFGISTVQAEINYGLLSQKEDFGSTIELMDVYETEL